MKKTIIILAAAVILGILAIPFVAQAQRPGKGPLAEKMKEADKNNDGKITLEELQAVLPKMTEVRFKKMDRNNDGVISPADRGQQDSNRPGRGRDRDGNMPGDLMGKLKEADKDGDKKVTFEEAKAVFPKMDEEKFKKLDTNNDGVLSREDHKGQGMPGHPGGGMMGPMLEKIRKADSNNDQKLSYEELKTVFPEITEEKFNKADKDGDGQLAREEMRNIMTERMKAADTDKDGKISREEANAAFPKMTDEAFAKLDRNGDGFLSPDDRKN